MSRADLMLSALLHGEPRSRRELFEHAGCFYLSNNAASELRKRGFRIDMWRDGDLYLYRLVAGPVSEGDPRSDPYGGATVALAGSASSTEGPSPSLTGSSLSELGPQSPPRAHRDAGDGDSFPGWSGPGSLNDGQLTLTEAA